MSPPKVLLLSPPWLTPVSPSLAVVTLQPMLRAAGIGCDALHGSLLFPPTSAGVGELENYAQYLFLPLLNDDLSAFDAIEAMVRRRNDDVSMDGLLPIGGAELLRSARLRGLFHKDIERARRCVERCVEIATRPEYDVLGVTATFETQLPAALAIARRAKLRRPDLKIAFGGAACFESQGDGVGRSFPVVDAVCHTEGEHVIVPLVEALRGQRPMSSVAGVAYVDEAGTLHHNPSPPLLSDLDALPYPDYDGFFQEVSRSAWSHVPPRLYLETSRGCWWGQKHLCSFCGLNAEGLTFRRKSPERAFDEIRGLYQRYPQARGLQATDNILDMGYLKNVLPRLAAMPQDADRPLRIFFEVKSNLRKDQVRQLAQGGVYALQPGIESFSDGVLSLMDKGATGLTQVQFIKWAVEADIENVYNLIIRNPGERAEWYGEMTTLIDSIEHLPPPTSIVNMQLQRFSPYFMRPGSHGITNVRPRPYYRDLYQDAEVDIERLAYMFDFDHETLRDTELLAAHHAFVKRATAWQEGWEPRRALILEEGERWVISDRRRAPHRFDRIAGQSLAILRHLDKVRTSSAVERAFDHLDADVLGAALSLAQARRWCVRDARGRWLCVLPRHEPSPSPTTAEVRAPAPL